MGNQGNKGLRIEKKIYSFFKKNTIPTIIAARAQDDSNPGDLVRVGGTEAVSVAAAVWIGSETSVETVVSGAIVIMVCVGNAVTGVVLGTSVVTGVVGLVTYPLSLIRGFWFWLRRLT